VLWGGWTLIQVVFFSVAGFFHRYYLSMLAPGVAALAAIGLVLLWHDYQAARNGESAIWRGWLLPLALLVSAIAQAAILADYTGWNVWMTPLILGGTLLAAAVLVWYCSAGRPQARGRVARVRTQPGEHDAVHEGIAAEVKASASAADAMPARAGARLPRWMYAPLLATTFGLAVLLVGPVTWTAVSLFGGANGALPAAGPTAPLALAGGGPTGGLPGGAPGGFPAGGFPGGPPRGGAGAFGPPPNGVSAPTFAPGSAAGAPTAAPGANGPQSQADSQLIAYLEANQGLARYLFATLSAQTAAPYIIATGSPVMTLGGFTGADQILTLSQLQALIRSGQVRYFLLSGRDGGFGGPGSSGNAQLVQWVEAHGTLVAASAYGAVAASAGQLYVVSSAAAS
jgi:4-amino-4-deoxy-L-arabinose transferase-like glycosyltransferase